MKNFIYLTQVEDELLFHYILHSQTLSGCSLYKPIISLSKYLTWNNNDNKKQNKTFLTTAGLINEPSLVRMVCYLYTQNLCLFQVSTVSGQNTDFFWWIGAFKHLASPTGKHTIQTPFMLTVNAPSSAAKQQHNHQKYHQLTVWYLLLEQYWKH